MYRKNTPNYDKYPVIEFGNCEEGLFCGWREVLERLGSAVSGKENIYIDSYQGVNTDEIFGHAESMGFRTFCTEDCMKDDETIREMTFQYVTDDRLFGYRTRLELADFFDRALVKEKRRELNEDDRTTLIAGPGASFFMEERGVLCCADMPRQSILERYKNNSINNLGISNDEEDFESKYRRGWFLDWRVLDWHKRDIFEKISFLMDTTDDKRPVMIQADLLRNCLCCVSERPFRMVPFLIRGHGAVSG